ncbi:putative death-receptor fusion protein-domain-containing protein [Tirmania nivea]|nr:putative death-receptor fusion protein-domain-containing protein [Tirmania nivea]
MLITPQDVSSSTTAAATDASADDARQLFARILHTASLPSLANTHRTAACDILSTWLFRAAAPTLLDTPSSIQLLLRAPFHPPTPLASSSDTASHRIALFTALTQLLLANFDSSASAALMKALKDLYGTLLACYRDLFLLPPVPGGDEGEVDVYITHLIQQTLSLLGLSSAALQSTPPPLSQPTATRVPERRRKAAYFILEALVSRRTVSAKHLLAAAESSSPHGRPHGYPLLLQHLLTTVSADRALASAAAKTFLALIAARKTEFLAEYPTQQELGVAEWTSVWNRLLRAALRGELVSPEDRGLREAGEDKAGALARGNLTTYVLPGVFRLSGADGLKDFIAGFGVVSGSGVQAGEEWDVNAWLCCIRVGREIGFVDDICDSSSADSPCELAPSASTAMHLPPRVLPPLLTHPSLSIRISALTLLTASRQTTQLPSSVSLSLLRAHLPHFHALTDPEGRNVVAGQIKAFIERLAAGSAFAARRAIKERRRGGVEAEESARGLEAQLDEIRRFVVWYVGFIRSQLLPGKSFPRVGMALRVLRMWAGSGLDLPPPQPVRDSHTTSPNSSVQFPFRVPIFDGSTREGREMARLLLECLFHSFEDVRVEAAIVIKAGLLPASYTKVALDSRFIRRCFTKVKAGGGRARDSDGLARVLEIVYEAATTWEGGLKIEGDLLGKDGRVSGSVTLATPLEYVAYLVNALLCDTFLAKLKSGGLVEGVTGCAAIHGVISGLRLILERRDICDHISRTTGEEITAWRALHQKLISFCCDMWSLAGPVLCAAAPEGHTLELEDEEDANGGVEDFYSTGGDVTTQTLMSYAWRVIKESSELLSALISHARYPDIINHEDISRSGELLLAQLANSRHSGAFSAVSPCLLQLSKRCFACPDPAARELPRRWLAENSSLIVTRTGAITRRSAGIPFLIIGILTAETDNHRPLLHETFARFVEIAKLPPPERKAGGEKANNECGGTKMDLPQVHALNCIKALFCDSRLGPIVSDLIGHGLEVAVGCFASPVWAIRNGGLMLFTALLNRLFGTSRSRNDNTFTANLYTTKRFFLKYPAVRGVLLNQLREGVESLSLSSATSPSSNVPIVEMVYPALSLVSRLGVSPGYSEMEEFKPLILECMKSKIWKVREVAAKAYVTLVGPGECIQEIKSLLSTKEKTWKQNTLHGNLCAVKCMLERRVGQVPAATGEQVSVIARHIAETLKGGFQELVKENQCFVTRALYLELTGLIAFNYDEWFTASLGASSPESVRVIQASVTPLRHVLSEYATKNTILSEQYSGSKFVGNLLFREQVATIMAHCVIGAEPSLNVVEEVFSLIEGDDDEITLAISKVLLGQPVKLNMSGNHTHTLENILWNKVIDDSNWAQVRVACMQLLDLVLGKRFMEGDLSHGKVVDWRVLLDLIKRPRTIPLKEASLLVLGKMMLRVWASKSRQRQELLTQWIEQVAAASHDEMSYTSRECALESLKGMAPIMDLSSSDSDIRPYSSLLRLHISLYDFLNDDNHDIRENASAIVTQNVFHMACPMTPLAASELLARKLGEIFQTEILEPAVTKIIGQKDIHQLIDEARKENVVLFTKEKQNLWVDNVREIGLWREIIERVLITHQGGGGKIKAAMGRLQSFVRDGFGALIEYRSEIEGTEKSRDGADGPLGWTTSSEDIFVLGWRVFAALGVMKAWRRLAPVEGLDGVWLEVVGLEKRYGGAGVFEDASVRSEE